MRFPPRCPRRLRTKAEGEERGGPDPNEGPEERALYARALASLARRDFGRRELGVRLARRGASEATIEAVLARLEREGWLDEERFVRERIRVLLARGWGPLRLRADLARSGLGRKAVDTRLDSYGTEVLDAARALCRRRFGVGWERDPTRVARARALLARRGFEPSTFRSLLRGRVAVPDTDDGGAFEGQ